MDRWSSQLEDTMHGGRIPYCVNKYIDEVGGAVFRFTSALAANKTGAANYTDQSPCSQKSSPPQNERYSRSHMK